MSLNASNIKQYALNYIKAKIREDSINAKYEFYKIKDYLKQRKNSIVCQYTNGCSDEEILIRNILKNELFEASNENLYLEIQFLILMNKLNRELKVEKIKCRKYKTPDFLISNKFYQPLALIECTTFELSEKDSWLLNKPLATVIKTPSSLLPEFTVPEQFLTLLLGFDRFKKKIQEKVQQLDTYVRYNPNFQNIQKFIILDISWFVFDTRIFNINLIEQVLPKWRERFLHGAGNKDQIRLLNLVYEIRNVLHGKDITVLCTVNGMHDLLLNEIGCFIAITADRIFPFSQRNFIKFQRTLDKTIYEFNYNEFVEDRWCENNLFYSTKCGKVFCPRFYNVIGNFLDAYFVCHLSKKRFPEKNWLKKLDKEIKYFESLDKKYNSILNKFVIPRYEELWAKFVSEGICHTLIKPSLIYLKLYHYMFEKLYVNLHSQRLIGDRQIHYIQSIEYNEDYYNFYKIKFLSLYKNEDEFKEKWYEIVEALGLYEFNTLNQQVKLHYQIMFHFV